AFLPKDHDPDSFVRAHGKDGLEKLLREAAPLADYYFTWLEEGYGRSLEGKSCIAQESNRVLAKVRNTFEADLLVRRAVDQLNIRETLLRAPLGQGEVRPAAKTPGPRPGDSGPGRDAAERSLVGLMLRFPAMIEQVARDAGADAFVGPE